jgi:prevent-host-death family protein
MEALLSVYEARTHFSNYVQRASLGESFVVTSHGKPMAKIVPMQVITNEEEVRDAKRRSAVERILARRQDPAWPKVSADEIRAWTHEGHRW